MGRITIYLAPLLGALLCLSSAAAATGTHQSAEYRLKAAYLYNFAKFIEWPADAQGRSALPLTICVLGKSPIADTLDVVAGKTVHNRRIDICYLDRIEDMKACDVLFIGTSESARLVGILAQVGERSILTVSDIKGFALTGGMIGFVFVNDKLRFEINQRASQNSGLRISAKLLKLAAKVLE